MRRDLEVAAEALSPDRRRSEMLSTSSSSPSSPSVLTTALASSRGVEDESVTSQTAHSVNESLRGLTREDLNESTSTTDAAAVPELDDAAEAVTARLWAQASLFFREADRNHNGVLTHTEIRIFLRQHLDEKLKFGVHESGWRGLWEAMDRNKDGQLDEHEWCQFFVKTVSPFSHAWSGELEQGSRIRTVTERGKIKASSRRKKGSNSTSGVRVGNIKKGVKSSRKLSPYAARPRRNRPADPYDILHTPPKELDGPQMADSKAAEASSSSPSSSSARIEVEVSDVMSTNRGIQNGGTPPLAQTKSPAMGSVLARSGGHGTTPHWSPLRSSEERWLDLGMSPHRPRAHGYVPRHGKVAALENDHNSALGIHEPRSTIRRSPSAAIYHEPSIVRHLTEGDDRRDDGGDDSNDAEVGLDEELIDRDAEEDKEGGDILLEDSLDLGARVSAAEMLVRLRGVAGLVDGEGGAPQEEDEADTDETAKPASRKIKKLGAGKRKKMIPLDSKAGAVHKLKRPPKKKDKLKVVEEERERRIHEREQRRRKQAAQSSSFGMDDTSVSASLSMGLATAPLPRAREQKAPSSKTRRRPHSKTKKASRDKRKKSVRVGADGSGGGDSSVANKARAASAASLRRATARKKASKAGRRSGHLRSSKSAKKSARGATTSGASESSEAKIHKSSSRFSGSASMRVHQQAHQHLGGTGRRSQLLNNSYSGSIGLAHGDFARVRGGAGGVAGANAGTAMGAGVGQRWAEIKSSLVPRQGLGAKSSKTKRAASAGKKKMKTKKAKGGSTSRLQRLRAEREALEAAVREGDEALEQAAAAAAAAQQAGHQGTHASLGQQYRAKHKRRFSLILAEIQDDAEGLEQPHLR